MSETTEKAFQDIKIGDNVFFDIELTPDKVKRFAELTGDFNPLHMDEGFARNSQFQQRITHGMFLASYFSTLVGMYLPGKNALYLGQELDFSTPVPVRNQKLRISGTVINKTDSTRTITIKTEIHDESNKLVVSGKGRVMIMEHFREEDLAVENTGLDLSGRIALVTGSSRGIGAQTAVILAKHGAKVVINYSKGEEEAYSVAETIKSFNGEALVVKADVSDSDEIKKMFEKVQNHWGGIDILVNNASTVPLPVPLKDSSWTYYDKDLNVILKGSYLCSMEAIKSMTEKKSGTIINILSSCVIGAPPPSEGSYVVAKYSLLGLTKVMAQELGPMGIRVNGVAPGMTDTALTSHLPRRLKDVMAFQTPLKRNAQALDTARTVLLLCSDLSNFINGVVIPVCGGYSML